MSRQREIQVLLLEDDPATANAMVAWLTHEGFSVTATTTLEETRVHLATHEVSAAILDRDVPDGDGLDLLRDSELGEADIIMVTGHSDTPEVVEAVRIGALDYLEKPVDLDRLRELLERVRRRWAGTEEVHAALAGARDSGNFGYLVGAAPPMLTVYEQIARVAPTDATVFLVGETGTGKEVVARTTRRFSRRKGDPFVAVNCGAIPSNLVESELFGHVKGAFTGAVRSRPGVFERADGGTLFLDELTEMSSELQTRLLRVLETRAVTRVGGTESRSVDVRIIAATNRDPRLAVEEGELREDLLYRLLVFPIELPPLRDRKEDIPRLARGFCQNATNEYEVSYDLSEKILHGLANHDWPGNVRELRNAVERLVILRADAFRADDFVPEIKKQAKTKDTGLGIAPGMSIADAERILIEATLAHVAGDKNEAAELLGISLKTLYNRLNSYEEGLSGE